MGKGYPGLAIRTSQGRGSDPERQRWRLRDCHHASFNAARAPHQAPEWRINVQEACERSETHSSSHYQQNPRENFGKVWLSEEHNSPSDNTAICLQPTVLHLTKNTQGKSEVSFDGIRSTWHFWALELVPNHPKTTSPQSGKSPCRKHWGTSQQLGSTTIHWSPLKDCYLCLLTWFPCIPTLISRRPSQRLLKTARNTTSAFTDSLVRIWVSFCAYFLKTTSLSTVVTEFFN